MRYQTEQKLYTGSPCRASWEHSELWSDGQTIVAESVVTPYGERRSYEPSPVFLGQIYRQLMGGDSTSLEAATPEEVAWLLQELKE